MDFLNNDSFYDDLIRTTIKLNRKLSREISVS
jgi:hypothetical protein